MENNVNKIISEKRTVSKEATEFTLEIIKDINDGIELQTTENDQDKKVTKQARMETSEKISEDKNTLNILGTATFPNNKPPIQNTQSNNLFFRSNFKVYATLTEENILGEPLGSLGKDSRNPFIFRVLCITFVMLLLTGTVCYSIIITDLKNVFIKFACVLSLFGGLGLIIVNLMFNYIRFTRELPCNVLMLLLTVAFGISMTGVSIALRNGRLISIAFIGTSIVVLACMALALTGFDFTKWMIYVVVISVVLLLIVLGVTVYSVWISPGKDLRVFELVVGSLFLLLQAVTLIIELQMIIGGKSIELGEEDYAIAAFMLYTSVLMLFLRLLGLLATVDSMDCFGEDNDDY